MGPGFGNQSGAEIVLDRDDIARAGLAFVGQATISVVSSQQVERRTFTGLVDQVESNGDGTVTLRLRGREAVLEDQPMAGLTVFEGTDAREAVYSLLRGGGLPSNLLEGVWTPPDALRGFVVGADIAGLAVEGAREVAGVTITSHNELKSRVPDTDFARSFLDANAWAIAAVSARTLFDAEVDALRRIRTAVDALRALSAFSYPLLGGRFRAFDRGSAAAQISGPHSVLVAEASSTAGWFRSLDTPVLSGEPIDLARNMSGVAASVSEAPRAELSRALAAWRGAADARDDRGSRRKSLTFDGVIR